MISRRDFVKIAGVAPLLSPTAVLDAENPAKKGFLKDTNPVIKSITLFKSTGNFARFVGMNAYDNAPKGINSNNPLVRIDLSDGTFGIGPGGYTQVNEQILSRVKAMVGKDPFSLYNWNKDKITGVAASPFHDLFFDSGYAWIEAPLLDAMGKLRQVPVWKLFGESAREAIDPYDGALYFEEIANKTDISIIADIGKRIKNEGYRAIKMKLGRPLKWLPGEAGLNRDIEALIALREAVGNNFTIMADANNGYKDHFDWALKLVKAGAKQKLYFMEEIFPDNTAMYQKLRQALLEDNMFVPIAEGETIRDLKVFDQYYKDGVYHYIQPDMATSGMSNVLFTAKKAESYPHVNLIPHVWQNQLGLIMSMHASKIQKNIPFVEDSRFFEHAFITNGYTFHQGQWFIPDKPGWGIELSADYKQYMVGKETILS
jgi:L-alanine-DL-glutamate epimerase-like enolase superfamily enzyme